MKKIILALSLGLSVGAPAAPSCDLIAKQFRALPRVGAKGFWKRYFKLYEKNTPCLDGLYGEETADLNARWLDQYWSTIDALKDTSPKFQSFVIKNINATLNEDQLKNVAKLAQEKCPARLTEFCQSLSQQTKSALEERAQ